MRGSARRVTSGWCVYLLACGDGTLYAGVTNDLPKRLAAHTSGRGARYTRGRGPVRPVYVEPCADRGEALSREHALKQLTRRQKLKLCAAPLGGARILDAFDRDAS